MRKHSLLLILFLCMSNILSAQTSNAGWLEFNPDIYVGKENKWYITPEVGYRATNLSGSHQAFLRPHVGYKINKYFTAEAGGWFGVAWSKSTVSKYELGFYQHISMSTPSWNGLSLGLRIRPEERFGHTANSGSTKFGFVTRIRPHIKYSLPVWKSKSLYVQALTEVFNYWTSKDYFNDALWIAGRVGLSPTKQFKMIFEYNYAFTYKTGSTSHGNRFRLITYYSFL